MVWKIAFVTIVFSFLSRIEPAYSQPQEGYTSFIDKDSKLVGWFPEKQWFRDNIPFIDLPDRVIEEVYYYRFGSHKRHLRYTVPGAGYITTEFVHAAGYAQKWDTINAAAGHHIAESRWLSDQRYLKDYINYWVREGGGNQQYSEWIAYEAYNAFLLNNDQDFLISQLPGLVKNYEGWYERFENEMDLFFITPHDDAQEYSAASVQTDDPVRGGLGYRPSHNSEMYGNAVAIAKIAALAGNLTLKADFENRATKLRAAILDKLWDNERSFFYHMQRLDNPTNELLDSREEVGLYPWRFKVPTNDSKYTDAWAQVLDPQGFDAKYGPTTTEKRSQWYIGDQTPPTCCWWNGNSWPYSTSHTLYSLAALVRDYPSTPTITKQTYVDLLHKYAVTQHKEGKPYVAECHSPDNDYWVCDSFDWSEHYAHSTYVDLVLGDLIGIHGSEGNEILISPLVPEDWTHFLAENVLYHGHNLTVLYDRDGSVYGAEQAGLLVFIDGVLVGASEELGPLLVQIPESVSLPKGIRLENYASNPDKKGYPRATASFTAPVDDPWQATDGRIFYDVIPANRWTNFGSPNEVDWFEIDFGPGRIKEVNEVKVYFYTEEEAGLDVRCPKEIAVEVFDIETDSWIAVENQEMSPSVCAGNDVHVIKFTSVPTQKVLLKFTRDVENNFYVGITEIEIWAPFPSSGQGVYEAEDSYLTGDSLLSGSASASGGSFVELPPIDSSALEFTGLWVESSGDYELKLFYANIENENAEISLVVNNMDKIQVVLPPTDGTEEEIFDGTSVSIQASLWAGNNVLIFRNNVNSLGSVLIDSLSIVAK